MLQKMYDKAAEAKARYEAQMAGELPSQWKARRLRGLRTVRFVSRFLAGAGCVIAFMLSCDGASERVLFQSMVLAVMMMGQWCVLQWPLNDAIYIAEQEAIMERRTNRALRKKERETGGKEAA